MSFHGRARSSSKLHCELLSNGWELCASKAGAVVDPSALRAAAPNWIATTVPSTVASSMRAAGRWSLDAGPQRFDAEDWWYRLRFSAAPKQAHERLALVFEGLATVADVWLNDAPILHSENMFLAHAVDLGQQLRDHNELLIKFHALDALLAIKRPRPRWKAPMIENQQLRWFRTTVLGRTPGWSPPAAAVGPWRDIRLERRQDFHVSNLHLRSTLENGSGKLRLRCDVAPVGEELELNKASLRITRGERAYSAPLQRRGQTACFEAEMAIPQPDLWWPHTHGEPALYKVDMEIHSSGVGETYAPLMLDLGHTGFRNLKLDTTHDNFSLSVNDTPIFCRGACWTPLDIVSLQNDPARLQRIFDQICDAGMNMLRVGGTMVYEDASFLDLCDSRGVLLWQDFMFANMDYPEDEIFIGNVTAEIRQQLALLGGRPSLAVLCGNSEVEQQAAMFGATRERWSPKLFHEILPALAHEDCPEIPYWPSSAHGGAFPHQGNSGTTSYYGVGAYLRPLSDARRAEIRFATECLAFANVPEERTLAAIPSDRGIKVHHPQWKARSPRDLGAGWDFDDVRDHYLSELFNVQPLHLRYSDHERYLQLSRVAPGEAMAGAMREWRSGRSTCRGALVWFLRDFWPGAGWGLIDALDLPKAPYFFLSRLQQPKAIFLSDEGGNGVFAHLINETAEPLQGTVEIVLYRNGENVVGRCNRSVVIAARGVMELPVASLLDGFVDLNHSYRFGPPVCDTMAAVLTSEQGEVLARDFYFPSGQNTTMEPDIGLAAHVHPRSDGDAELSIQTRRFARFVTVQIDGFAADDQYFHVAPGTDRRVYLRRLKPAAAITGQIRALNSFTACRVMTPK